MPIDERHHRSARRPRVRRLQRPGWIERQDHPRPRRRFAKRVARSTPIHRAETSSVKAVKVKVKSSLRAKGPGGLEIVVRSQGQGSGAGRRRACSHVGSGQSSEGPSSSSRQGCYVSWEGGVWEERAPSACAVHRAVRGACFALAPQCGPSKRGVPTSLGHPTTRKGQGIHRLIRSVEEKPPVRPLETVAGRCKYNLRIEAE